MSGLRSVEAEFHTIGVNVELIEYRWNEPTRSSNLNALHTLSRLILPSTLVSHMRIGDCDFVRGDKMVFIPAGLPVLSRTGQGHAKFGLVQFSPERFRALTGHGREWDPAEIKRCGDIKSPHLDLLIQRLLAEAAMPGLASDVLVDALSVAVMVELHRYLNGSLPERSERVGGLAPWQIRRLTDYLTSCADGPVLVVDLAKLCGISAGHMQRAFKRTTGRTLHSYIEEVRLARAKSLLTTTDLPIKQIAGRLGFANASGLTIAFRRVAGETPGSFRRRMAMLN